MEVVEKQRQYYKSVRDFQEVCHILTLCLWVFLLLCCFIYSCICLFAWFFRKKSCSCYYNCWPLLLLFYYGAKIFLVVVVDNLSVFVLFCKSFVKIFSSEWRKSFTDYQLPK